MCDGLAQRRVRDRVEGGHQEDPPRVRGQHEDGGHRGRPPGLAPHLGQAELDGPRLQGRHVAMFDSVWNGEIQFGVVETTCFNACLLYSLF